MSTSKTTRAAGAVLTGALLAGLFTVTSAAPARAEYIEPSPAEITAVEYRGTVNWYVNYGATRLGALTASKTYFDQDLIPAEANAEIATRSADHLAATPSTVSGGTKSERAWVRKVASKHRIKGLRIVIGTKFSSTSVQRCWTERGAIASSDPDALKSVVVCTEGVQVTIRESLVKKHSATVTAILKGVA